MDTRTLQNYCANTAVSNSLITVPPNEVCWRQGRDSGSVPCYTLWPRPASARTFGNRVITRSPEEVWKLVSARKWKRKHLDALRRQFGDQALFEALFCAFTQKPPVPCSEQEAPGDFLLELKPRGLQDLCTLIRVSLSGWNLSVEQLPYYFRDTYGVESVRAAIDQLNSDTSLAEHEREALRTYQYWLHLQPKAEQSGST